MKANLTFLTTARTTVTQFSSGKSLYVCLPLVLTSVGSGLIGQDLSVRYLDLISLVSNFMLISSETLNFLPCLCQNCTALNLWSSDCSHILHRYVCVCVCVLALLHLYHVWAGHTHTHTHTANWAQQTERTTQPPK